jgi:DNA adenine methylase Dam
MIKPPVHYTGNKYKQLPAILEHLPDGCDTFVEVFGGSGVISLNCAPYFDNIVYNEISPQVSELFFHVTHTPEFADIVNEIDTRYPSDKESYYRLRTHYNTMSDSAEKVAVLYCLVCRAFNNQIRFNRKGEFNLPYGSRNYIDLNRIYTALSVSSNYSIDVTNKDFREVCESYLNDTKATLLLDPPYHTTTATYNTGWTEQDEHDLYAYLDQLDMNGVKWMLTNVLRNRGTTNEIFAQWLDTNTYVDIELNGEYGNSSRFKSEHKTLELLVKNF